MDAGTCAGTSRRLGEEVAGTAPMVTAWLLVEQPGPWGRSAPSDSRLDPGVAAALERRADQVEGLRVQLVRRPARAGVTGQASEPRTALVCHPGGPGGWLRRMEFTDPADLLDLDLGQVAAGMAPPGTRPHDRPVYLVCTNGARDRCCAEVGRPLAAALRDRFGDAVWETTHVGGHRFAGNVVCLPDGTYYGRLDAARGAEVIATHREGRLDLHRLRGRSPLPPPAQAAEVAVRRRSGLTAAGDVTVEGFEKRGEGAGEVVTVRLRVGEGVVAVAVRRRPTGRTRPVSCGGEPEDPGWFEVGEPAPL